MNVSGEPLLSPALLARSMLPPWGAARHRLPLPEARLLRLGRDALAAAAASLRPGPVLVPAYICAEALEGLAAAGREVRFYPLGPDLGPDWDMLNAVAEGGSGRRPFGRLTTPPAALVIVHYFGIPADAVRARRWCDERGVALVEDCAHSFLSRVNGRQVGSFGDFAIFSFRKQLPVASGAALCDNRGSDGPTLQLALRGLGLLPALREVAAWAVFKSGSARLRGWLAPALSDERGLRAATPGRAPGMDWVTQRVIARLAPRFQEIAERRRANYLLLERELSGLPRVRPLFRSLAAGAAPWGFPLLVEGGQRPRDELLAVLLHEGIGAWTWPELPPQVTEAGHPEAWRLAQETAVLPVHQGLSIRQVQHVADTVAGWALS